MKKLFRTVLAVAAAATAMASCQKSMMEEEGGISAVVSFNASFPETKTTFGTAEAGKYPVLWQDGDKVAVSIGLTTPLKDLEVTPSTDKKTATFSKDVTLPGEGPWTFYIVSPSAAMESATSSEKSMTLALPTDQTPTDVSVDPAAQVLLGMATVTSVPSEAIPVTFDHLAAYGKVSLSNLPTSAKVTALALTFDQPVTGSWDYYPAESDVTKKFAGKTVSTDVNLTTEKTENVFFAVVPNGVAVKSVKVTIFTEGGDYEKEVAIPEKTFKAGVVSAFTVDMTGATKVTEKNVVKWVSSEAGNEVFVKGEGEATIEPATATWLTWNKETKTVSWTEATMPRQAKLSFADGASYDLTQIDAKILAGKWTLSGDIRTGTTKGSVAKATASSTSGASYGSKGGITKNNWYDDGWTTSSKVSGGVELPVEVAYNAEGEDPGKYLNPTATGTSADRAKAQKNNLVLTGLYENLTMPARFEVNYEEQWARLYLVVENKNQQLTSGVYSGEYASFQTELQKPNGDWELGFANGGLNYYLGALTVVGDVVKSSYAASQTCVYYPSYNMVGIIVNRFATETSTAGTELIRSTKSAWTKTHINASGSAYARVFQNALTFEMKESVSPEPEPEPTTVDEVLTKAGKNPADYEKYPFWYTKNAWYQSTAASNYTKLQTTTSGGNFNKFVATNLIQKGEIPNGSVVVTMGGDFGYRPEGWVDASTKTANRPDRTSVQVTEVDDNWWVRGTQTFGLRGFNLDMNKSNLTDAEMEEVIQKFALYIPKSTKTLPDPDAVFTAASYKLDDYTKLDLTYFTYAYYNSTDGTRGGVLQNKDNVPTANNLGEFVATDFIAKDAIPNGSVIVVCDGYQYRPEGWQVQGEKNTGSRPGNVTEAITVVDDAWWGNFTVRAFNLAYTGNPGIPVTEMDHVKASFAIYVPKADPDPTHIDTPEKLVAFLTASTAETTTDYIMTKDVDMKGVTVPTAAGFKGTFDGKGKTIKNLAATAPLFATLDGTVKNVTLEGAFTGTGDGKAALFAPIAENKGTIDGVTNKATVSYSVENGTEPILVAGVVAFSTGTLNKCTNSGNVTFTSTNGIVGGGAAGVAGFQAAAVTECVNNGSVSCVSLYTNAKAMKVEGVAFTEALAPTNAALPTAAGIVGFGGEGFSIKDSQNHGAVTFSQTKIEAFPTKGSVNMNRHQVAGVVANPWGSIEGCSNDAAITASLVTSDGTAMSGSKCEYICCVGGIAGGDYFANGQNVSGLKGCTNSGTVKLISDAAQSNSVVGGIIGWPGVEGAQATKTEGCTNSGEIVLQGTVKARIGGVQGGTGNMVGCTNTGNVHVISANATSVAGLLCGFHSQGHVIENCVAQGTLTGDVKLDGVGGLMGNIGNAAHTTGAGCAANCTIVCTDDTANKGIIVGKYNGKTKQINLGTDESPIKVKGTLAGTVLTVENFTTLLEGPANADASIHVIKAVYGE